MFVNLPQRLYLKEQLVARVSNSLSILGDLIYIGLVHLVPAICANYIFKLHCIKLIAYYKFQDLKYGKSTVKV